MFAIVANGFQGILTTKKELDLVLGIYPYPKFAKVKTREEGLEFLRRHSRKISYRYKEYGDTFKRGFVTLEYFIDNNTIFANVYTDKIGKVFINNTDDSTILDVRPDFIKIKISNVVLNDLLIRHHVIAIRRLLNILGPIVSVCLVVPDISIYLALTSYKGKDAVIMSAQRAIEKRIGGMSYTIKE